MVLEDKGEQCSFVVKLVTDSCQAYTLGTTLAVDLLSPLCVEHPVRSRQEDVSVDAISYFAWEPKGR